MKIFLRYLISLILFFNSFVFAGTKAITKSDIIEGVKTQTNYLGDKGHFEKNANAVSAYSNTTASSRPETGTGGTPTLTCTRTTSNVVDGDGSLLITKTGNQFGQGCSIPFSLPTNKVSSFTIEFEYKLATGTFTAGSPTTESDIIVYLYDISASKLLEPQNIKLFSNSTTIRDTFKATFQNNLGSSNYRLIWHVQNNATNSFNLAIDNVSITESVNLTGTPISDLVDKGTITIASTGTTPTKGTVGTDRVQTARFGDRSYFLYNYTQTAAGSAGTGDYLFSLPSGMSFDSSKVSFYTGAISNNALYAQYALGKATTRYANALGAPTGVNVGRGVIIPYDATKFRVYVLDETATGTVAQTGNFIGVNGFNFGGLFIAYSFEFDAPIAGQSASTQISDGYESREIVASYVRTTSQSIPNATDTTVIYDGKFVDKTNAMNTTNGRFTCQSYGIYDIDASTFFTNFTGAVANFLQLRFIRRNSAGTMVQDFYKDGFTFQAAVALEPTLRASHSFECNAGDTLEVILYQSTGAARTTIANINYVNIRKRSSPQTISAADKLNARYTTTGNTIGTTDTLIVFSSKDFDSHNRYSTSTGLYTCESAMKLQISSTVVSNAVTLATTQRILVKVYKNGSLYQIIGGERGTGSSDNQIATGAPVTVSCLAGDNVSIYASSGVATTISTASFSIYRID